MNASAHLLDKIAPSIVGVHSHIPTTHVSTAVGLGTDRRATGIVVDPDGLVLTVNYALMGAKSVIVTFGNGDQFHAKVAGQDYSSGLGLLQIDARDCAYVKATSSVGCTLGQDVFIIASVGNEGRCADGGMVTYLGPFDALWEFTLDRCLMTSAMNSGLGGGAVCNTLGELVAVSYLSMPDIGKSGLAIPAEYYTNARDELLAHGKRVSGPVRAWVGLLSYTLREHVVVAGVMPGGPCDKAGLRPGDVVLAVGGHEISDRRALYDGVGMRRPGEHVNIKVFRNNQVQTFAVPGIKIEDYFG